MRGTRGGGTDPAGVLKGAIGCAFSIIPYPRCGVAYVDSTGNRRVSFRQCHARCHSRACFLSTWRGKPGWGRVTLAPADSRNSCARFEHRRDSRAVFRDESRPIPFSSRRDTRRESPLVGHALSCRQQNR